MSHDTADIAQKVIDNIDRFRADLLERLGNDHTYGDLTEYMLPDAFHHMRVFVDLLEAHMNRHPELYPGIDMVVMPTRIKGDQDLGWFYLSIEAKGLDMNSVAGFGTTEIARIRFPGGFYASLGGDDDDPSLSIEYHLVKTPENIRGVI